MRRDGWIQLGAVGSLLLCLGASALLTPTIAASAGRARLVPADTAEKGDPPEVAAGIAMGAFRGVFVNMLWMRANALKEEGKYYEAVDLARTITRLQPRFPRVWVFHAWNLAYNISVATQTPKERWQWVQSGIRLLRDEGIPANPSDVLIHKELAWLFMHKVQGIMDDANWLYKRELAREWTIVLGPPPRRTAEVLTTQQMIDAYVEWLSRIAEAKDSLDELASAEPGVGELVDALRTRAGLDLTGQLWNAAGNGPGEQLLTMIEEQRSLNRIQETMGLSGSGPRVNRQALDIINGLPDPKPFFALARFIRKRLVVDKYHMEPDRMIRYTKEYGPLDWRHGCAHALYWSARGVDEGYYRVNARNKGDYDFLNTDRLTIQAIQELYRSGEIYYDAFNPQFYIQLPNPDYIDFYESTLYKLNQRAVFSPRKGEWVNAEKGRTWTMYSGGYENFLKDVIRYMYRTGDMEKANFYYKKLREFPYLPSNRDPAEYDTTLAVTVDKFAENEISKEDRYTSTYVAREEVVGALQRAFLRGLLVDNAKLYKAQMDYARKFHEVFTKRQVFDTAVTRDERGRMEVMDRDFDTFAGKVLATFIVAAGIPDGPIMFRKAPVELQTRAYPILVQSPIREQLDAAEAAGGTGFDIWFHAPAGLENYRKEFEERMKINRQKGTIEQK